MANLDAFKRVFRVEVEKKKAQGEQAPSWADVKRLVKDQQLFDEDEMQDPNFKAQLKEKATEIAIEIMSKEPEKERPESTKKRKSNARQEDGDERPAKRVKQAKTSKKMVNSESDLDTEAKPSQKSNSKPKPKPASREKRKKSRQTIEDSDEGEGGAHSRMIKQREDSSAVDSDLEAAGPPRSPEVNENAAAGKRRIPAAEVAELSDSALSIVIDGTPVKAKKTKKEDKKKEAKETKSKKKEKSPKGKSKGSAANDPDEEQIKRLKSFVVACGVRKKWVKEFEGIEDHPKKQISRLKEILQELGMTGRMSIEKAKAIREQREFAEELREVVQFGARRGLQKNEEGTRSKGKGKEPPPDNTSEDEEDLGANPPARKKNLLALSDDQSDEE